MVNKWHSLSMGRFDLANDGPCRFEDFSELSWAAQLHGVNFDGDIRLRRQPLKIGRVRFAIVVGKQMHLYEFSLFDSLTDGTQVVAEFATCNLQVRHSDPRQESFFCHRRILQDFVRHASFLIPHLDSSGEIG
jgi:hypothetical protein